MIRRDRISYWATVTDTPGKMEWKETPLSEFAVFKHNPHMSFLLSRISVYPYAFQQMPRVIGNDIMAEVLDKNPDLPWLVAPLIIFREEQWRDPDKAESDDTRAQYPRAVNSEESLAGYLTFDNGPGYRKWKEAERAAAQAERMGESTRSERIEIGDDWAKFQNDMLHEMTLFAACLAQQPCLRKLVTPADRMGPL
jgi:hypothetical protein